MAPKNLPPQAKQSLIVNYIQNSLTVHTLKELEKTLPSVASINGMQVKDYLQALTDEGKIRVEKIGSGNWYWSFLSEEKKSRIDALAKLTVEKKKLDDAARELCDKLALATGAGGEHDDEGNAAQEDVRAGLVAEQAQLTEDLHTCKAELLRYRDADPAEVLLKKQQALALKQKAELWTDNVAILEQWLCHALGGDYEKLDAIKRSCYGDEYDVEAQGLKEL
ncbi:hypothetical protein MMC07_004015 [Pseudocyphellaria aurata]|nr:hypothetical protein [Pseudocyphellaria aurata]